MLVLEPNRLQARRRGTLYGLAIGDALGAAVEFKSPGEFAPLTCYRSGGPHRLATGQWTDDTSMALALAESIGQMGWNLTDQIKRYCDWWINGTYSVNGECFDIGTTTRYALEQFTRTNNVETAALIGEDNSGNGSIMRLAPVAIKFHHMCAERLHELSLLAEDSSRTTHASEQCKSACRYFTLILSGLLNGEKREIVLSPDWEPLQKLRQIKKLHPYIEKVANGSYRNVGVLGKITGSGWVVASLEAALWAFYDANNFEEAVLKAVNLGDDADTTGAVCGQLAGAYWGFDNIPQSLIDGLAKKEMLEQALSSLGLGTVIIKSIGI